MMAKASVEVKAFDHVLDVADEVIRSVMSKVQTSYVGATAIAIALGKLCAQYDVDPQTVIELMKIAHQETTGIANENQH